MSNHVAFNVGRVAVITGAADGIGFAAAQRFAYFGMHVLLADIDADKLSSATETVAAVASQRGGRVASHQLDVAQLDQVLALKDYALTTFGRVDVLMNNAGTSRKTTSWDGLGDWQHLLNVNFWGVVHGLHAFTEAMIAQHSPALIINTGSKQGITNPPGNPAYNVSKAAVKTATEALQHSLRNTANCQLSAHLLVPGYTFTGMTARQVSDKPDGAWSADQVIDYLVAAINRGSFYVICPDNEVTSREDQRRILWAAGDLVHDRPALSRWHADYQDAFRQFEA